MTNPERGQPKMMGRTHAWVFALIFAVATVVPAVAQKKPPLTYQQLQTLVHAHTPDETVAQAVQLRGLAFAPDPALVEALTAKGAGPMTVAAVNAKVQSATLHISGPVASEVVLDGKSQGYINTPGVLNLPGVRVGKHQLLVKMEGYKSWTTALTLADKEDKQLTADMQWIGGYLTLEAPAGTSVTIEKVGDYTAPFSDLPLIGGTYTIHATNKAVDPPTVTVTATVVDGQHGVTKLPMKVNIAAALETARAQLARKDFKGAFESADRVLDADPKNNEAETIVTNSYLASGDFAHFTTEAIRAIKQTGSVKLYVMHNHEIGKLRPHPAVVTLSADSFTFDPLDNYPSKCTHPAFTAPWAAVSKVGLMSGRHLLVHVRADIPGKDGKVKNGELDFFPSVINTAETADGFTDDSKQSAEAMAKLMISIKDKNY